MLDILQYVCVCVCVWTGYIVACSAQTCPVSIDVMGCIFLVTSGQNCLPSRREERTGESEARLGTEDKDARVCTETGKVRT